MWFNTWDWHVKNSETTTWFNHWMVWLHYWRMPLLLFISGAGTYMALGKRSRGQFASERVRRLLIPVIFGMLVIVPPQIYFEHIGDYSGYGDFYKTVFEFVPYPKGSFSWHHLWFVVYLLIYSLLLLPLLVYLRSERSKRFLDFATRMMSTTLGMLFYPILILFLTQALLRPFFPDETHDLTDVAFFVFYMCFFVLGMIFYADQRLWSAAGKNRKGLLTGACLILLVFYFFYVNLYGDMLMTRETAELGFDISAIFLSWSVLITVIGFGQYYLNRPHPVLPHVNEGLYPFYILHQTAIIAIGFFVCQLPWSIAAKFWTIVVLSLIGCVAVYFAVIRPFNVMRILFGMKAKKAVNFN